MQKIEENNNIKIEVGSVVKSKEGLFRILIMNDKMVLLIQLEIEKLNIIRISMDFFKYEVANREFVPVLWQEEKIPVERLTKEEDEELTRKSMLIERMLQALYPAWDCLQTRTLKQEVSALQNELRCSKATMYKLLRRYLQSGRQKTALLDGRKGEKNRNNEYNWGEALRGYGDSKVQNDDKLKAIFDEGYSFYIQNAKNGVSLMAAYRHLLAKYYVATEFKDGSLDSKYLPANEIPSYKRFWNYCNRKNPGMLSKMKMSSRERRNNERLLHGNSQSGCLGPGHIVEVDEVEIDMINVASTDSRQTVGRAVMYLAVDVYSCCIVGCWVDYDNNSFVGITNLLMNLLENPEERYRRYGLEVPEGICPYGFVPMELRTDQGAEYTSGDMRRIGREIGMNITLVAPGTGSLKGLVEQAFHQFQELLRGAAAGKGIILKRYGSQHYETACTDIEDVRKIAYNFVIYFNQHKRNYPMDKNMLKEKVPPVPAAIWKYGGENIMSPRWITGRMRDQFIFALLKTDRQFKISRRGITYKGLYYELMEDWFLDKMRKAGNRKEAITGIRYDPRSINNIYMMQNGEIKKIPLNEIREEQRSFRDMTWKEYDKLWKEKREADKVLEAQDLQASALAARQMADVVEAAKRMQGQQGKNRKKNLRDAMRQEKAAITAENTVETRMGLGSIPEQQYQSIDSAVEVEDKGKKTAVIEVLEDLDFSDMNDSFGV